MSDFDRYSAALHRAAVAAPVLVLDRDVLDANTAAVAAVVESDHTLRLVAKSLPVPALIRRVLTSWASDRVMTFSVAMLQQLEESVPGCDQLMGKPVPVAAVRSLCATAGGRRLAERVVWLVDTAARVQQYQRLSTEVGVELSVAVEVDVGLHRGGFTPDDLGAGLRAIATSSSLRFAGVMGYEPHLPALPAALGIRHKARAEFESGYEHALKSCAEVFGGQAVSHGIRNTAGSKTLADRAGSSMFNDFSVGSLLVAPSDFATVSTPQVAPALFIATPVLKVVDHLRIPGLGGSRPVQMALAKGARRGVYIHGGHWLADPVHPPGLSYSEVIGRSSNQELLVTGNALPLEVDDFVYLQPHQSEAVMLQFGAIAVVSGDAVVEWWEPFAPSA